MDDKELLVNAMHEIRDLRRCNEILRAKVEMIDLFATVLGTTAYRPSQGMSPDVAWFLQKKIDEIEESRKPRPPKTGGAPPSSSDENDGIPF